MEIPASPANHLLASVVNGRIAADARLLNAKAALWRLGGIGALVGVSALGIGLGAAAGLWGWARIQDTTTTAQTIAGAIATALERATVRTTGEVTLKDASVSVSPGGEVRLDASTPLRIDPTSRIAVTGTVGVAGEVPRPTPEQLNGRQATGREQPAKVVTNYTVFKSVPYVGGIVSTGWKFDSSEQATPSVQYCYYVERLEADADMSVRIDLAQDGHLMPQTKSRGAVNVIGAAQNCVWFDGRATNLNLNQAPQARSY